MSPDEITLKEWMTAQFGDLRDDIKILRSSIIGRDKFEAWCNRTVLLETQIREHDKRLDEISQVVFLLKVLVGLLVPIVVAVVINLIKGWLG